MANRHARCSPVPRSVGGLAVSVHVAPGQRISEGLNCGVSGSVGVWNGTGPSAQGGLGGADSPKEGSWFGEVGVAWSIGRVSAYESCYYVFPSIKSWF